MAPEVVLRKLEMLRRLLADLAPYEHASANVIQAEHYTVERILELLVTASADVLQHLLAERQVIAASYRDVFHKAGENGLLEKELATRLEAAAGMRNVLVHLYDDIDLAIVRASIVPARRDFAALIAALTPFANAL